MLVNTNYNTGLGFYSTILNKYEIKTINNLKKTDIFNSINYYLLHRNKKGNIKNNTLKKYEIPQIWNFFFKYFENIVKKLGKYFCIKNSK